METKPHIIEFNKIGQPSLGYISVAEVGKNIPFEIERVYWTYFTPNHVERGSHAHVELKQVIFSVAGIIHFDLEDVEGNQHHFVLDEPNKGLFVPPGYWRTIKFSHNAVLLCLASMHYDEKDYIRSYSEFQKLSK